MARNASPLTNWSQYIPLRLASGLVQCFSPGQNLHTASAIGSALYRLNRKRRERTHQNIRWSYPEWDEGQVRTIAEKSYQSMIQLAMVDAHIMTRVLTPETWPAYIRLMGAKPVVEKLIQNKPVIMLTGHCGNWELLGYTLSMMGYPITALARPLDNPLINDWIVRIREVYGLKILTKWGAAKELERHIQAGQHLGFIADQNAGDRGVFVPFFGRLASSYKSIALLAMHYKIPITIAQARRVGQTFKYDLVCSDLIEPEDWADQEDPMFYITARFNRGIEDLIRAAPEQYLWLHRRWKSRPDHERQGKPVPQRTIEKLESLPWMTDDELGRVVEWSNRAARDHAHTGGAPS
tara:strand:- start:163 stop:1215 length:1053 start_codon:yes stop_codon:yes gene_type:complete